MREKLIGKLHHFLFKVKFQLLILLILSLLLFLGACAICTGENCQVNNMLRESPPKLKVEEQIETEKGFSSIAIKILVTLFGGLAVRRLTKQ